MAPESGPGGAFRPLIWPVEAAAHTPGGESASLDRAPAGVPRLPGAPLLRDPVPRPGQSGSDPDETP